MAKLSFGIKTACQNTTHESMIKIWQEADEIPVFEHAWLFDHLNPIQGDVAGPCYEGWTLLAAYAAMTRRIRVGHMVTGNTYRHPAVLAHMAATVDIVSNGRLDFGFGAGWNVYEHESNGIPLYEVPERLRRFREACELIKRLWTEPVVTYEGQYYQLKEARLEPKPVQNPHPPFVIGGGGEKVTLKIAAQHAAVWNFSGGTPDQLTHKLNVLRDHCETVGRNPEEIMISIQPSVNYADLPETAATIQALVDVGANHIVLNLRPPVPDGIVKRLADELIPLIKG
ncbi:MAG: LLM class F420-dependent oxidoreductase [Chloroflexota bacterium]